MTSRFDFDAVIFDMDGTLLDSMSYWRRINADFLSARDLEPPDEIRADLMSTSNRVCARLYAEKYDLHMSPQEIMAEYRDRMSVYYRTEILPKPHVFDYLDHLRGAGKRLCVGTASPSALAVPALARHGMLNRFEFVASAFDLGIPKEGPDFYLHVARQLGIAPARCVMFEDAPYAMEGAKSAGMLVFGIEDATQKPFEARIQAVCDVYIRDFGQLCV